MVAYALFFASGFAALLYQVIWQRMLAIFSGIDVFAVTIIVAAFMAGLGCGNLVGGHLADALSARRRLLLFAASEVAIAVFAFSSKWLYYDVLYERFGALSGEPLVLAPVLFASLLWPTFFMGISLPLLSRSVAVDAESAPVRIGALYGLNTLGAAIGSFATAWVLMRTVGFETCIQLGVALNGCVALGALALVPALPAGESEATSATGPPPAIRDGEPAGLPFLAWIFLYGMSGFIALGLEILWFRLLGVLIKSTAFTFGTLLGVFLTCSALGTLVGLRWAPRVRRPATFFLAFQAGVTLYSGLALSALIRGLGVIPGLGDLWAYLGRYEPVNVGAAIAILGRAGVGAALGTDREGQVVANFLLLYFAVPFLLMGPATFLMGLSFPFLQRVVQTELAFVGRRVGWLQTANIVGSMLGAILVGFVLLDWLGSARSFEVLIALGALYLALWLSEVWRNEAWGPLAALGLAGVFAYSVVQAIPDPAWFWSKLHGVTPARILFAEDRSGLSVLKRQRRHGQPGLTVFVNGRGQSSVPFGGTHTLLGVTPLLLHPKPERLAVIGLGSGDTVFSIGGRSETSEIRCYEIIGAQLATLERANRELGYAGLRSLLEDPRVRFEFSDGRKAIVSGDEKYDLIEADALRPNSAYSGTLYSYEYFSSMRSHLEPGGFLVSWAPTSRVERTFRKALPYVLKVGPILIGSNEAIPIDPSAVRARARDPHTVAYYRSAGIDVTAIAEKILAQVESREDELVSQNAGDVNLDLFPKDEYLVPQ